MVVRALRGIAGVLSLLVLCNCSSHQHRLLYDELGGDVGIARIVDNFVTNIEYDPIIVEYFVGIDIEVFRRQLGSQLCQISDGPCIYEGDSMEEVHKGQGITAGHFNRTVDLLIQAMEQANIPYPTQNRLLQRLALLRDEIINK